MLTTSNVQTYLFYPKHETLCGCYGKWIIFCLKPFLDDIWQHLHAVVDVLRQKGSVVCMKVSTNRPNPHATRQDAGVIMVYTSRQKTEEMTRETVLQVGQYLVMVFSDKHLFSNPFSTSDRIFFKTEEQSRKGSQMSGAIRNTLTSLILPNHCIEQMKTSLSLTTPTSFPKASLAPPKKTVNFHMSPQSLHEMGAVWSPETNQWFAPNDKVQAKMILAAQQDAENARPTPNDVLSIMTMNLWGNVDEFKRPKVKEHDAIRMNYIANTIETHQPDVICLQEVTEELLVVLHPLLLTQGYVACSEPCAKQRLLIYAHSVHITFHFIDTKQLNGCQLVQLTHKATLIDFLVANLHLPSGHARSDLRILCLQQVLMHLETARQPFIVCGDTNFTFEQDLYVARVLPEFVHDAWISAGSPMHFRATYDSQTNTNLTQPYGNRVGARFDRVFYDTRTFHVQHFQLLCTTPCLENKAHPSDHYGVLTLFTL